jgi:hypothetical protein
MSQKISQRNDSSSTSKSQSRKRSADPLQNPLQKRRTHDWKSTLNGEDEQCDKDGGRPGHDNRDEDENNDTGDKNQYNVVANDEHNQATQEISSDDNADEACEQEDNVRNSEVGEDNDDNCRKHPGRGIVRNALLTSNADDGHTHPIPELQLPTQSTSTQNIASCVPNLQSPSSGISTVDSTRNRMDVGNLVSVLPMGTSSEFSTTSKFRILRMVSPAYAMNSSCTFTSMRDPGWSSIVWLSL